MSEIKVTASQIQSAVNQFKAVAENKKTEKIALNFGISNLQTAQKLTECTDNFHGILNTLLSNTIKTAQQIEHSKEKFTFVDNNLSTKITSEKR